MKFVIDPEPNAARDEILGSIRANLAASRRHDRRSEVGGRRSEVSPHNVEASVAHPGDGSATAPSRSIADIGVSRGSILEVFKENLEAVGGHCIVARDENEIAEALNQIVSDLQHGPLRARRIALSDAAGLDRLTQSLPVDEVSAVPAAPELFDYDVGITRAQAGIAETGTLVLQSESERHRLVSLVPPVHIAIVKATQICMTLGEALTMMKGSGGADLSPTITFITGPSRTADIELTLAIGVHGPQELYVIIAAETPE